MSPGLPLAVDAHSPIPIRRQLTEQLKHLIESGGVPPDRALPSIRELAAFLGVNPNTVARVIDDLKHGGYVEARRGKGVFVAPVPPARPSPHLRERFLQATVIQAAARGMTADDVAVGVLSLAGVRPPAVRGAVAVLLVECTPSELQFFAGELEAHLPVHVERVLLADLAALTRREKGAGPWAAAVTSFSHLSAVERALAGAGIPVVALLAEAHHETLHRLARLPAGTRVGVVSESAHGLEHGLAHAGLSNVVLVGTCPPEGAALGRLVRRADVVVCSAPAAERVQGLAGAGVQVVIDDRTLDPRAIERLAALLARPDGDGRVAAPPALARGPRPRPSRGPRPARDAALAAVRGT